jgi:hypothetical protein
MFLNHQLNLKETSIEAKARKRKNFSTRVAFQNLLKKIALKKLITFDN